MKIAIGSDHGGFVLKKQILDLLHTLQYEVDDVGCYSLDSVDYPGFAESVCQKVLCKEADKGILICGTGIGMSMAANRHKGIRAALCNEQFAALMSREHNDANILCMGERVIGAGVAGEVVRTWLKTSFSGGRHLKRISLFST